MNPLPDFFHATVPHSGTRYTNDLFTNAGVLVDTWVHPKKQPKTEGQLMHWRHFDHLFWQFDQKYSEHWECKKFVTVRDPLSVLATHWRTYTGKDVDRQRRHAMVIQNNLKMHYRVQMAWIAVEDPFIHKVENGLDELCEWSGLNLFTTGDRHSSGGSEFKDAVAARDLDKIKDLLGNTELWSWFTQDHCPRLQQLYVDRLGYDFWWL